eukprot:584900-Alexandrium_andersonii.AAC.1
MAVSPLRKAARRLVAGGARRRRRALEQQLGIRRRLDRLLSRDSLQQRPDLPQQRTGPLDKAEHGA